MRKIGPVTAFGAFIAAAVAIGLVITFVSGRTAPPGGGTGSAGGAPSTSSTAPGSTTPARPTGPAVTVVKIDNVAVARPQTGLGSADIVYVEPVEGGLTRLVAVYFGEPPRLVGPVRSARQTDIELLAQFGTPTLTYSGAASELLPLLREAPLRLSSPQQVTGPYFRSGRRATPHNLYVDASALPEPAERAMRPAFRFGPAPDGGEPVDSAGARYGAASYGFYWSDEAGRWLISMDGHPMISTESGRLSASSVVLQRVPVSDGVHIEDASGAVSPVVSTVGSGPATVLRDGTKYPGNWTRPEPALPTRYTTSSGEPLPLAEGPVWVLLLPD